jgi:hypothetical protein
MDIPQINIKGKDIDIIRIPSVPDYLLDPPTAVPIYPPVTTQVGVPIVDIPGCVEAHEQNSDRERSGILSDDDPKGVKVYCDAGVPSFNPIDYNAGKLKWSGEAEVPPVKSPEAPEANAPEIPKDAASAVTKCPTEAQQLKEPVGTLVDSGKKKIVEYRLIGQECIPIKEDLKIPDQIIKAIPSAGQVTTTASIAVVATAAAAATPLLLKVVKPIVKQIIKKVQKLLGKEPPKLSRLEIQTNTYREKKGMTPLKFGVKKKKKK